MTILPAKRSASAAEETTENNGQNGNADRNVRRRDEHNIPHTSNDQSMGVSRRTQYRCGTSTPEPNLRKRFKDSKHARRKQQRDRERERERKAKRPEVSEEEMEDGNTSSSPESQLAEQASCSNIDNQLVVETEDGTGFNSEDEYTSLNPFRNQHLTDEEWQARDALFARCLFNHFGYEIKQMNEDGACLFRAIADQIYGDQDLHYMVRSSCMDYIVKNKDFFAAYVTEDFDKYVARKRKWNVHGNHLEIQALSEMYNRTIEVYCYKIEPINIFNGSSRNTDEPIRLSYHRMCHYNSINNPNKPSVLVGLGLPSYHTIDLNRRRMVDAVRASEELLIEQTMLEDKIKATDWEATNEALEEEIARESYIQYFRDAEKRLKPQGHAIAGSSSTITSGVCSSPRSCRRGSCSPKGSMSPKGGSSPKYNSTSSRSSPRIATTSICSTSDFPGTYENSTIMPFKSTEAEKMYSDTLINTSSNASPKASNGFSTFEPHFNTEYAEYSEVCKRNETSLPRSSETLASDIQSTSSSCPPGEIPQRILSAEDWEDGIMAQVMAESCKTYLDELKRNSKKRLGSPGPSTSS